LEPIAIVTALALDVNFERHFRVQQNTLEQLVIFVPALWLFGYYVHPWWGAGLGLVFIIGRYLYYRGYVGDPAKRGTGFIIGEVGQGLLLIGGLAGAVVAYFS
jgi:hypothetical protein